LSLSISLLIDRYRPALVRSGKHTGQGINNILTGLEAGAPPRRDINNNKLLDESLYFYLSLSPLEREESVVRLTGQRARDWPGNQPYLAYLNDPDGHARRKKESSWEQSCPPKQNSGGFPGATGTLKTQQQQQHRAAREIIIRSTGAN